MTRLDELWELDGLWEEAETWLDGIADTVSHRCYREHSLTGIRAIQRDVSKHLGWIDRVLLEIEAQAAAAGNDNNLS